MDRTLIQLLRCLRIWPLITSSRPKP
jgi:hypothetical protein